MPPPPRASSRARSRSTPRRGRSATARRSSRRPRPTFAPGRSADMSGSKIPFAPKGETATAMTEPFRSIALTVNGEDVRETVEARTSLVDFLRERLGLTGSHVGCEQGACGACTVRLDDGTGRGCLVLAVPCARSPGRTIEGVSDTGGIADPQAAFLAPTPPQCGFPTPPLL